MVQVDIEYPKICDITKQMAEQNLKVKMYALVKEKQVKLKNNNPNDRYIDLNIMDGSGIINVKIWDYDELTDQKLKVGTIVQLLAQVVLFNTKVYLKVLREDNYNYIRQAKENEKSLSDFIERVDGITPQLMQEKYFNAICNYQNVYLRDLLQSIFIDSNIADLFFTMYAAKNVHHTFEAGLAYHSDEVAGYSKLMGQSNRLSSDSIDLIDAVSRLHDIGKVEEYTIPPFVEITERGRRYGHAYLGAMIVERYIQDMPCFPEGLKDDLIHGIISHHGKLEEGAIVVPSTIEAIIVSNADRASANIEGTIDFIGKDTSDGTITDYNRIYDQFFIKPKNMAA